MRGSRVPYLSQTTVPPMRLVPAKLALLLGKTYVQEQPLRWGYLTPAAEESRHGRVRLEGPGPAP